MGFAGKDDIAGGIINTGYEGIGHALLEHRGSLFERIGGDKFNIWEMEGGFLGYWVVH